MSAGRAGVDRAHLIWSKALELAPHEQLKFRHPLDRLLECEVEIRQLATQAARDRFPREHGKLVVENNGAPCSQWFEPLPWVPHAWQGIRLNPRS